jgi:tRNA pseudouridine(38-40) synthase
MRNLKLLLSYDGTDFSGWQRQRDQRTVQQVLEEAMRAFMRSARSSISTQLHFIIQTCSSRH